MRGTPSTRRAVRSSPLARPHVQAYEKTVAPLLEKLEAAKKKGPVVCVHARTGLMPELRRVDNGKRTRPDDEMHGTRSSGISIDDVRGVVNCAQDAEREAGGAASWFIAADSPSLRADFAKKFPGKILLADWAPDPFAAYQVGGGSRGGGRRRPRAQAEPGQLREALARTFAEWCARARAATASSRRAAAAADGRGRRGRDPERDGALRRAAGRALPARRRRVADGAAARRGRGGALICGWFACHRARARMFSKSDGGATREVLFCLRDLAFRSSIYDAAPQNPRFA